MSSELTADSGEQLAGVELHEPSAAAARQRLARRGWSSTITNGDFFQARPSAAYDAVLGNPPYVRYQDHTGTARARSQAAALAQGVRLSGLASSWAAFVVHSAQLLTPDGRMGLVLPGELLTVSYAAEVGTSASIERNDSVGSMHSTDGMASRTPLASSVVSASSARVVRASVSRREMASFAAFTIVATRLCATLRSSARRPANAFSPRDKQTILAVVDLDKAGGDIAESCRTRLEDLTGHTFDWRHIALTPAQVATYSIPMVPRTDHREGHGGTRRVAETEALGVTRLRRIVAFELARLLPERLVAVHARERAERAKVLKALGVKPT